jgi:hypothetical protein
MTLWHETPEARALMAAIVNEQPDCGYVRRNSFGERMPFYKGKNARAFRKLWESACEAAMDANDHDAYAQLVNHQHPDDLIDRALTIPILDLSAEELRDPFPNAEAA